MAFLGKKSAEQLFDGESLATEGDEKTIIKEVFVKKAVEAAMQPDEIDKILPFITTQNGRVSLKKLEEELQRPAT